MVWRQTEWKTWNTYLGTKKEVFNAKLYFIGKVLDIALRGGQKGHGRTSLETTTTWTKVNICVDLRVVIV